MLERNSKSEKKCRWNVWLLACLILFGAQSVFSCTCELPDPKVTLKERIQESVNEATTVFEGEVLKIEDASSLSRRVTFKVTARFKGPKSVQLDVFTGLGGGDCGYPFEKGKKYLVFGFGGRDKTIRTNICTLTNSLEEAKKELTILEELMTDDSRH